MQLVTNQSKDKAYPLRDDLTEALYELDERLSTTDTATTPIASTFVTERAGGTAEYI